MNGEDWTTMRMVVWWMVVLVKVLVRWCWCWVLRRRTHHGGRMGGRLGLPGVVGDGREPFPSLFTLRQRFLRLLQEPAGDEEGKTRRWNDADDADDVDGSVGRPRGILQIMQILQVSLFDAFYSSGRSWGFRRLQDRYDLDCRGVRRFGPFGRVAVVGGARQVGGAVVGGRVDGS